MKSDRLKERIQNLLSRKTEEQLLRENSYTLMSNYLSEIERLQSISGFSRKDLAEKIKTSPSYLTQVFRGGKPLNFFTIAKIQNALNIRFEVTSVSNDNFLNICDEAKFFENIQNYKTKNGTWIWKNVDFKNKPEYSDYVLDKGPKNENKAISA